jgi:hypothetical protein
MLSHRQQQLISSQSWHKQLLLDAHEVSLLLVAPTVYDQGLGTVLSHRLATTDQRPVACTSSCVICATMIGRAPMLSHRQQQLISDQWRCTNERNHAVSTVAATVAAAV